MHIKHCINIGVTRFLQACLNERKQYVKKVIHAPIMTCLATFHIQTSGQHFFHTEASGYLAIASIDKRLVCKS